VEFSRERLASSINKGGKGNKDTQREKKILLFGFAFSAKEVACCSPTFNKMLV
jgi:hypothetical protein